MNKPLKFIFVTLLASVSFQSTVIAAPVKSMSLEVFKDGQKRFWEVSVACDGGMQPQLMFRPVDKDQWCSSEIGSLCNKNKVSLSRQICADDFSQQLVNYRSGQSVIIVKADLVKVKPVAKVVAEVVKPNAPVNNFSKVASKENLLNEQMQIEEQRILIEQKRLELRRKQIELQKRQLNAN